MTKTEQDLVSYMILHQYGTLYIMLLKNCSVTTNHTFLFEIVHLILYNLHNCELGD